MAALPIEILFGIYLGLLVGVLPALAAWGLGFTFRYVAGVALPGFGVAVLAIALAGVNGGLLALADQSVIQSSNAPRVVTAILVVALLAMYAHSKGDQMAVTVPRRLSFDRLRERSLALDLADVVGGREEVRIHVVGQVADMEGYPPLPEPLRAEIQRAEFTFPTDLRIGELERRLADRLTTEFDLGAVSVSIDERGRARVVAAPPFSGLSKRVTGDRRAVSVDALLPTGLARGDEVTLTTADAEVRGTVVSAASRESPAPPSAEARPADPPTGDDAETGSLPAPTTDGGEGRLTVAVARPDVQALLRADRATVVVESRGTRREYELISLLRRADRRFRRVTVSADGPLDGESLAGARVRDTYDVAVLGVRTDAGWNVAPGAETALHAGDELYAVGTREALDRFGEAVA